MKASQVCNHSSLPEVLQQQAGQPQLTYGPLKNNHTMFHPLCPYYIIIHDYEADGTVSVTSKYTYYLVQRHEQYRQYTYKITLKNTRATIMQWKSNNYYMFQVCVSSLRNPACNAHEPHCHWWPAWLYNIFAHSLTKGMIFDKKLLNIRVVFSLSLQLLSETFFVIRRNEQDVIQNVYRSLCKVPVILVRF
jgi:hypothetical protein